VRPRFSRSATISCSSFISFRISSTSRASLGLLASSESIHFMKAVFFAAMISSTSSMRLASLRQPTRGARARRSSATHTSVGF
jgi:hypothetical protein